MYPAGVLGHPHLFQAGGWATVKPLGYVLFSFLFRVKNSSSSSLVVDGLVAGKSLALPGYKQSGLSYAIRSSDGWWTALVPG